MSGRRSYGGVRHRRRMHGRGIVDWLKKAHGFVKGNKLISSVGNALAGVHPLFGKIGQAAATAGYGRKRVYRAGALKLAGAARRMRGHGLSLAGRRHRRR
jgi:hypothetical protein